MGITPLGKNKLGVHIVDFSGHGIASALNTFRLHAIIQEASVEDCLHPQTYMGMLNNKLKQLLTTGQFATMFYGVIDFDEREMHYATAGTTTPVICAMKEKKVRLLSGDGIPLGVVKDAEYELKKTPFSKDDILMLYSDALIENPNAEGEMIEEPRLLRFVEEAVAENSDISPPELLEVVLGLLYKHSGSRVGDDLTVVAIGKPTQGSLDTQEE